MVPHGGTGAGSEFGAGEVLAAAARAFFPLTK
jgi:hypothetical protein